MSGIGGGVRLVAVGDLQLGDSATCVGFGFRSRVPSAALRDSLARFASQLGRWDLAFANLETPLSDVGLQPRRRRSRQLRGDPEYGAAIRSGGFTTLNVANNHALEHGRAAGVDSASRLESLGFQLCGRRGIDGWAATPAMQVVDGLRLAWLGYSLRPAGGPADERWHAEATGAEILADLARVRSQAAVVIVSLHWGEEFVPVPSAGEVALAHAMVDAGAHLILGHHPHVSRPVERYRGAIIAYSLGNFVGDMIWYPPLRDGLILDCTLTGQGVERVRVLRSAVDGSFLPRLDLGGEVPLAAGIAGLPEGEYVEQARGTVRAQRRALYRYTVRNLPRFEPGIVMDLVFNTLGGKVARLVRRRRDRIWG